ncbi:MAG: signal recognition particle-docking protein FtsY, partial [Pseudoxanthomonas sp.]
MASWFRRNKPDAEPKRRINIEELAAAFPAAPAATSVEPAVEPAAEPIAPTQADEARATAP